MVRSIINYIFTPCMFNFNYSWDRSRWSATKKDTRATERD